MPRCNEHSLYALRSNALRFALGAIVVLAALLRLPALATLPNGFFCDEASVGYDAYAVLLTQRDQYGTWLPLYARSFGDYDEFLYRYLTIPAVAWLGLNEFATRLPAAIAGILTVLCLYWLGKAYWGTLVGLLAALLLALSPWHVQFSRIAFRAILFPLCFCAGLSLFLLGLRKPRYLIASAFMFALSLYTYSPARVFVPLFLLAAVILYRHELLRYWRFALGAAMLLAVLALPAVYFWFTPQGMARAQATMIVSPLQNLLFYGSYFSPRFLFFEGDPAPRHHAGLFGELYPFELISVSFGLVMLCRPLRKMHALLLIWLLLYPIPATLTGPETALRSIIGAPLFALLSAFGLYKLYHFTKERVHPNIVIGCIALLLLTSSAAFTYNYYVRYPRDSAQYWQYGMRDALSYAEHHQYHRVWVSDQFFIPHIFILFYTQYPPYLYQRNPITTLKQNSWFYTNYSIGKYHIGATSAIGEPPAHAEPFLLLLPAEEYAAQAAQHQSWHRVASIDAPNGAGVITLVEVRSP